MVPGAVRGLAGAGPARLGGNPRPGRRARSRRFRHRHGVGGGRGDPPRLPGGGGLPAGVDGRRARRRPLEHHPADRDPRPARDRGRDARLPRPRPARAGGGAPSRSPRRSTRSRSPARRSRDIAVNPAKMLAIALADANPLVWGGTVLAARRRAGRRVDPPRAADAPRWPATPSTCCRCSRRRASGTSSSTLSPTRSPSRGRCCCCSTTARRSRSSASSGAGCWPRPPRAAYASRT